MTKKQSINILVPVYNEEGSLEHLYSEVNVVMEQQPEMDWCITFVNDGSTDNSLAVLRDMAQRYSHVRVVALSRNFGKEIALSAGLEYNQEDVVMMIDSDLQHPPKYIPEFLEKWRAGAQVVVGVRTVDGTDSIIKKAGSWGFYLLINKVSKVKIQPRATDFRLLDKEVVDAFTSMEEHNRIARGMIDWLGFERDYIEFAAEERHAGEATYDIRKLFKLAMDSFVSMTLLPLRLSVYLGVAILVVFGPLGLFMWVSRFLLNDRYDFSGPATLAVLIILLVGIILINIGFVGIYIANIHEQVRGRPLYVINKRFSTLRPTMTDAFDSPDVQPQQTTQHIATLLPDAAAPVHDTAPASVSVPATPVRSHSQHVAPAVVTYQHKGSGSAPTDTPVQGFANQDAVRQTATAASGDSAGGDQKNIVWLSWKDILHPAGGGAELVQHELCSRLAADGHSVVVITSRPRGAPAKETISGYTVVRKGNRYSVYWHAWRRYRAVYKDWADLVVEEINTVPFFSRRYIHTTTQSVLLYHQLARQIWFYEYFPPLNAIGYLIEPWALRIAHSSHRMKKAVRSEHAFGANSVVAMSPSTRKDLLRHGYQPKNVQVVSEGITLTPVADPSHVQKLSVPSIIAYGGIRPMKRTMHILKAFEDAKKSVPTMVLTIAGDGTGHYADKLKLAVRTSPYRSDITLAGRVDESEKAELLGAHHFIVSTAVKEGWGLTITEAASQGTPAIAYNVDGQRDAVFGGEAGVLIKPDVHELATVLTEVFDPSFDYTEVQNLAWLYSQAVTFDHSYSDFIAALSKDS